MSKFLHLYFDYWKYIILGLFWFMIFFVPLALANKLFMLSTSQALFAGLLEVGIGIALFLTFQMQGKLELMKTLFKDCQKLQSSH